MPIYEYKCSKCGYAFEELVKSWQKNTVTCPKCSSKKVGRMLSVFSASASSVGSPDACPIGSSCPSAGTACCTGGTCGLHHR